MSDSMARVLLYHPETCHTVSEGNRVIGIGTQIVVLVSAEHDVDSLLQRSKLGGDALPSFPAHQHDIRPHSGCVRRHPAKVRQVLWDVPWHRAIPTNTVFRRCGDNEGEVRHDSD